MPKKESELEITQRPEGIQAAITELERQKSFTNVRQLELISHDIKLEVKNIVIGITSLKPRLLFLPKRIKIGNIRAFNT